MTQCETCGKLVVATNEAELAKVETIMAQAKANGVENTEMIDRAGKQQQQPDELAERAAAFERSRRR